MGCALLGVACGSYAFSQAIDSNADTAIDPNATKPFPAADVLSGSTHERSAAYGRLYKDRIHDLLNNEIYRPFVNNPFSKEELQKYGEECGEVTKEVCTMLAAECEGIASGAGISYAEVMLLNLDEELRLMDKKEKPPGHCTAAATSPADSGDGHAYNGQTWDFYTRWAGKSTMIEWQ